MGSYLCKNKSGLYFDPLKILPECSKIDEYRRNVWLTVKPEPDKIIFALLTTVTQRPLVYIYIDTQQERMKLYTVLDALNSFLLNSILKIRFLKKEEFSFSGLKIVQEEEESKNKDSISYQSNDDSNVARQCDFKSKVHNNLNFINRNYYDDDDDDDDEQPLKCYKEQENEQKLIPISDKEILYEYAESYYACRPAYLSQNQIYCLRIEARSTHFFF